MSVVVGGLFECKPLRARLSVKQCESNWRQANDHATKLRYAKFQKARYYRRECVGCEIGRAHSESGERAAGVEEASVVALVSAPEPKKTKKRVELPVVQEPQELPKPQRAARPIPSPGRRVELDEELPDDEPDDEAPADGPDDETPEPEQVEPDPVVERKPEPAKREAVASPRRDDVEHVERLPAHEVERLESACRLASEAYRKMMQSGGRPLAAARYAPDVREMALKLYRHHGQLLAVSRATGISVSSLSWWVKRADYQRRRGEKFGDWSFRERELLEASGEAPSLPTGVVVTSAGVSVVEPAEPAAVEPEDDTLDPVASAMALLAKRDAIVIRLSEERARLVKRLADVDAALEAMGAESS
jgi:hypothetical protein